MGTHPIFESDFDCLTDLRKSNNGSRNSKANGRDACYAPTTAELHGQGPSSQADSEANRTHSKGNLYLARRYHLLRLSGSVFRFQDAKGDRRRHGRSAVEHDRANREDRKSKGRLGEEGEGNQRHRRGANESAKKVNHNKKRTHHFNQY